MKHLNIFIFFFITIFASSTLNAQINTSKVYRNVETMPVFPTCNATTNHDDRKACTDIELMKYVKQNIHYPDTTGDHNMSDLIIVEFVVSKTGHIIKPKIVKDIRGGYGSEIIRVLNKMNDDGIVWIPGRKEGQNVMVRQIVSMRFKLPTH